MTALEELDELALEQQTHGQDIKSLKNDARAAKTRGQSSLVQKQLDDIWNKVVLTHGKIETLNIPEHNYHKSLYYNQIQLQLNEVKNILASSEIDDPAASKGCRLHKYKLRAARAQLDNCRRWIAAPTTNITSEHWRVTLKEVSTAFNMFLERQSQTGHHCTDEEFDDAIKLDNDVMDLLNRLPTTAPPTSLSPPDANVEQRSSWKFEKLRLPSFEGGYAKWSEFKDRFRSAVHENTSLSMVDKMHMLKGHVRGEPARLIQHLTMSENSYLTAWNLLNDRYSNQRQLLSQLIDSILDQPKIKGSSGQQLIKLHDTTKECLQGIENMGYDVTSWSPIIGRIVTRLWDEETNKLYEQNLDKPREVPELSDILQFLEKRYHALAGRENHIAATNSTGPSCDMCALNHSITRCFKFQALKVHDRLKMVQSKQLCEKCLKKHQGKCQALYGCRECNRNHHSLLHINGQRPPHPNEHRPSHSNGQRSSQSNGRRAYTTLTDVDGDVDVDEPLLATALVNITTVHGDMFTARVLIDPGSQASLITENAVQRIGLPKHKIRAEVSGIGEGSPEIAKSKVFAQLYSRLKYTWCLNTELLVLSKLASTLPAQPLNYELVQHWENRTLADPHFYRPGGIDIILGVSDVCKLLLNGIQKQGGFMAQNSELGWLISGGPQPTNSKNIQVSSYMQTCDKDIAKELDRFWELEEIPTPGNQTAEDLICEENFKKTTKRGEDGKYTVSLPLKESPLILGDSKSRAIARLIQLEKRLGQDPKLRGEYNKFMSDYINLGHMEVIKINEHNDDGYYIPHHAVFKESSTTTKLRVVFDASCKTTRGSSLNEKMFVGPQLHNDITELLLRWRSHRIVFTADIEKMYRQIKMVKEHQKYQRILWRFHPQAAIKEYRLKTVTYGTSSAPYLAIRTLHQLAADEEADFPQAAEIIRRDFYVDDVLSGADNIDSAKRLQEELLHVMEKGGFNLRKWSSNTPQLLSTLPQDMVDQSTHELNAEDTKKSLGIIWDPKEDKCSFKICVSQMKTITKRVILSEISKIFDPLGWLAPVTILAKLLVQQLWKENVDWDQKLSEEYIIRWKKFYEELPQIEGIRIPRWMHKDAETELHGFCDASEKAYGAVVYSRTVYQERTYITLLQAKSKVAPIKMKTTLPRLELCSAHLLSQLLKKVRTTLAIEEKLTFAWSDSMIALAWIRGSTSKQETFVANRASDINRNMHCERWQHVRTHENPADHITRGIAPGKIQESELWWTGPTWLKKNRSEWPKQPDMPLPKQVAFQTLTTRISNDNVIEKFSDLNRMLRVLSYCRRWKNKIRGAMKIEETEKTLKQIIMQVQQVNFNAEIQAIGEGNSISKKSPIRTLTPFINEENILCVGGRLGNANLPYHQRHQILLPSKCQLSKLIIKNAHSATLHGGIETTLAFLRRKYWIPKAKDSIRATVRQCVKCIRFKAQTADQIMGDLPKARVTASRPFTHTGVDYAGPINVRTSKGRGQKSTKGYIAIFICLATKAIHLEVVSDMTTNSFLAAFKRFISRRGTVHHMYSDNGTNFVGAAKILRQEVIKIETSEDVQNKTAINGTTWHFIPAASPHFGGLWEAGVKSMKFHLKRQIGESTLTYEELTTLLNQIEACLNSRPLYASSNDHEDNEIITPGHFLIGQALVEPPNPVSTSINASISERWINIQKMKQSFWKSWSGEYLTRLQHRYKWNIAQDNLQPGRVVILKEKDVNPARWPLAKIEEIHPGKDGKVRVVTLKGHQGKTLKRAIVNLIPLPNDVSVTKEMETMSVTVHHMRNTTKNPLSLKKATTNSGKLFSILTCLFVLLSTVSAQVSILNVTSGVYVEHLGTAFVSRGQFRLKVEYEKRKIQEHIQNARQIEQHFLEICVKTMPDNKSIDCKALHHHLKAQTQKLEWVSHDLNLSTSATRKRRGILGTMLTAVFGVNDEVYQDITALSNNQKQLIKSNHHQSELMLAAAYSINETQHHINQQLAKYQQQLQQTNLEMDATKFVITMITMYQQGLNFISETIDQYGKISRVGDNRGNFFDIVSPAQVASSVKEASVLSGTGKEIRSDSLIKTEYRQNNTHLTIYGYFPIVDTVGYEIMKFTGTPINITNSSYTVFDISSSFAAVNYNQQQMIELTPEEFSRCIKIGEHAFACSPTSIRKLGSTNNCLIEAIYGNPEPCRHKTVKHRLEHIVWKQLLVQNTWLFITPYPTTIGVVCHTLRTNTRLTGAGILKLDNRCRIESKQHILLPNQLTEVAVKGAYIHPVPIQWNTTDVPTKSEPTETIYKSSDKFQNIIQEEIELAHDQDMTIWDTVKEHQTTVWTSTCLMVTVLGLITVAIMFMYKRDKNPRKLPAPVGIKLDELRTSPAPSMFTQ